MSLSALHYFAQNVRNQQAAFLEMINFLANRVRRLESDLASARLATDRARIIFDRRMANGLATINKESTNENNTDVDRVADARRLRINGKPCSKPWRCLNLPAPLAGSR
jgi:hypothetical protein